MPRPRRIDQGADKPRPRPSLNPRMVAMQRTLQKSRNAVKEQLLKELNDKRVPKIVAERYAEMFLKKHFDRRSQ